MKFSIPVIPCMAALEDHCYKDTDGGNITPYTFIMNVPGLGMFVVHGASQKIGTRLSPRETLGVCWGEPLDSLLKPEESFCFRIKEADLGQILRKACTLGVEDIEVSWEPDAEQLGNPAAGITGQMTSHYGTPVTFPVTLNKSLFSFTTSLLTTKTAHRVATIGYTGMLKDNKGWYIIGSASGDIDIQEIKQTVANLTNGCEIIEEDSMSTPTVPPPPPIDSVVKPPEAPAGETTANTSVTPPPPPPAPEAPRRRRATVAPPPPSEGDKGGDDDKGSEGETAQPGPEVTTGAAGPATEPPPAGDTGTTTPEEAPKKRKRRTRAEMEAAKALELEAAKAQIDIITKEHAQALDELGRMCDKENGSSSMTSSHAETEGEVAPAVIKEGKVIMPADAKDYAGDDNCSVYNVTNGSRHGVGGTIVPAATRGSGTETYGPHGKINYGESVNPDIILTGIIGRFELLLKDLKDVHRRISQDGMIRNQIREEVIEELKAKLLQLK